LFVINLFGVVVASAIVFVFFGFSTLQKIEEGDIKKEEQDNSVPAL